MVLARVSLEHVSLGWDCDSKPEEKACSYRDLLTLTDEWLSIGKLSEDVSGTLEQKTKDLVKRTKWATKQCWNLIEQKQNLNSLIQVSSQFFNKIRNHNDLENSVAAIAWNTRYIQNRKNNEIKLPAFFLILNIITEVNGISEFFPCGEKLQTLEHAKMQIHILEIHEQKIKLQERMKSYAYKISVNPVVESLTKFDYQLPFILVYDLL